MAYETRATTSGLIPDLCLTPPHVDADPEFSRYAAQGTNGFLWFAYPLIHEVLQRFRERVGRPSTAEHPFDATSAKRLLLPCLFETLKETLDVTMVLELNVARVQGCLNGATTEERFNSFCERLRQTDVRLALAKEYPVLFRSLYLQTMQWLECSLELLDRLSRDWELLRARVFAGGNPGSLTSIDMGAGDTHRGGRTVAILEFASGGKLVYKPHSQSVDVHFGEFLEWINQAGFETPFRVLCIVDRGCYGWSEFVAHESCSGSGEIERFYRRLGGYLAAFCIVRARDMHFGNLIAAAEYPVPVDLEALFHNEVTSEKDDPAIAAFSCSVMQVMLLPQPMYVSETAEVIDMSAFGATSDQPFPLGTSWSWENPATDEMRLVRNTTMPTMMARSRPRLAGREVVAEEHVETFLAGFRWVYRLIEAQRDELQASGGLLERFADDEVRFVARATAAYSAMLRSCNQPDRLRDALVREQLFEGLWLSAERETHLTRLIPAELNDLRNGDVPVFTSRPNSCDLWASDGERIPAFFDRPAMTLLREGLNRLGAEDLARQEGLIRSAIASVGGGAVSRNDVSASRKLRLTGGTEAIDLARAVGDKLCRDALENETCASWIGMEPMGAAGQASIQPLDLGLYSGLSGCAFFLGHLAVVSGDKSYERVARKAVALLRRRLEHGRNFGVPVAGLGAFTGVGGVIYALSHLAVLWQDASLIAEARMLAADVPSLVGVDNALDVIGGAAGAIAALEVLNRISASDDVLNAAVLCGERLLAQQQPQAHGVAWRTEVASSQPLTGFSHGAAGMAWALLKLAAWSGQSRFRATAEAALAYERSTFVMAEANWPDYRALAGKAQSAASCELAWCHGAPGIGLARIDNLQHMDDRETRHEISLALSKTLESELGKNHCLCHGDLGNVDVLLHAAEHVDESWWSGAGERLASQTLTAIAEQGCLCGGQAYLPPPGLMVGLAGIGYGALRLARPERVPSVLVLAPPAY